MSTSVTSLRPGPRLVLGGVVGGLALTSGIALTATSGWLIVRASERPVVLTLLTAIVAVRTFGMARPALRYLERLLTHDAALADLARRRSRVYRSLVPLTPARLGRRGRADLLTGVVDDLDDVVGAQIRAAVPVLSAAVAATVTLGLTAWLHPSTALVLLGLVAVAAGVAGLAWSLERAGQARLLAARAEVGAVAELVAHQSGEVRAVHGERRILDRLAAAHDELDTATLAQARGRTVSAGALLLAGGAAAALVALLLGRTGADLSPAVRALLVLTPVALVDALTPLTDAVRALARGRAAAVRMGAVLGQDPALAPTGTGRPDTGRVPHLRLDRVTAGWTEGATQLGPLTLDVPPGTRLAVVGANGSGKSTLLAVLARHLDPATGTYELDDRDARGLDLDAVRDLVAVVDDEPHVFASTLRENLRLAAPSSDDADLVAALDRAGLGAWLADLPDGLDTRLGARGRGVSGGERARLAIARAVLSGRPVVLLDEPVAHLDHATATAVLADLTRATAGRTVIMVSHRPDGLDAFDRVVDLSAVPTP